MGWQKNAKGFVGTPSETRMLALVDPSQSVHRHTCKEGEKLIAWLALAHESVRQRKKKLIRGPNNATGGGSASVSLPVTRALFHLLSKEGLASQITGGAGRRAHFETQHQFQSGGEATAA